MDYVPLTTTLTFDNTNDLQMVHISISDDIICESFETFYVSLGSLSAGCYVTENLLRVWIWDDESHFGTGEAHSIVLYFI